jgi:hypothetical protein
MNASTTCLDGTGSIEVKDFMGFSYATVLVMMNCWVKQEMWDEVTNLRRVRHNHFVGPENHSDIVSNVQIVDEELPLLLSAIQIFPCT